MLISITTYYLEMNSPDDLKPSTNAVAGLEICQAKIPLPELNRFFYTAVGGDWYWLDRISWSYEQWRQWVDRPDHQTWVAYQEGTPAGYFELESLPSDASRRGHLEQKPDRVVNIAYFGLLPSFIGKGIGGVLLTRAIQRAWAIEGTQRVTVNTCTLDGPQALKNYQARGFRILSAEASFYEIPEKAPGPWPGAR